MLGKSPGKLIQNNCHNIDFIGDLAIVYMVCLPLLLEYRAPVSQYHPIINVSFLIGIGVILFYWNLIHHCFMYSFTISVYDRYYSVFNIELL